MSTLYEEVPAMKSETNKQKKTSYGVFLIKNTRFVMSPILY